MGKNDFYEKSTSTSLYSSGGNTGSEANMRQELINTFDGSFPEVAKAQNALLRRVRRNSSNNKVACPCVDSITKEPDKDRFCPVCYGEGYLWDEESLQMYRTLEDSDTDNATSDHLRKPGLINIPLVVFYTRYDVEITEDDKIVEIILGLDGSVTTPIVRRSIYRIERAWDYRCDNGKLEYWKVFTHKEDVKYLNPPSYGDI